MDNLDGKTVLITGGAGFLGFHLCRAFRALGSRVVATSRQVQPAKSEGVEWLMPDLEDEADVRRLLRSVRPDIVYHLAGEVSAAPDADRVQPMFHSLLASTVNILTTALDEAQPRVILVGSMTEPDDERSAPTPSSPYSAAKWAASGYGRMFAALYDLPTVIVRPYIVYGPEQKPEKLISYVIRCCLGEDVPQLSSGRQRGDWIYVDDVIEGMIAAACSPDAVGQTLDLGTGELVAARDLVDIVVELTGAKIKPDFGARPDRPLERERRANIEHAKQVLGWSARTPLREGLARTVESIRSGQT